MGRDQRVARFPTRLTAQTSRPAPVTPQNPGTLNSQVQDARQGQRQIACPQNVGKPPSHPVSQVSLCSPGGGSQESRPQRGAVEGLESQRSGSNPDLTPRGVWPRARTQTVGLRFLGPLTGWQALQRWLMGEAPHAMLPGSKRQPRPAGCCLLLLRDSNSTNVQKLQRGQGPGLLPAPGSKERSEED